MKKLTSTFVFNCILICLTSGQILPTSNLEGTLSHSGQSFSVIIKLHTESTKPYSEIFIPEQFIFAKKASATTLSEDSIMLCFRDFQASYKGKIIHDSLYVSGLWIQRGQSFPLQLDFKNDNEAISFHRPQEPGEPFPYITRDFTIPNKKDNVNLSGTLTLPDTLAKHTLVILITGSGPQDRNEELAGHKPFFVIADYLTRNGIAVFRFDDRGVGQSTGNFGTATSQDFMNDVLSIVSYFKKHPYINSGRIGLIGHSEGGLIAMMAAARKKKDIGFIISLAGPGVNIIDLLLRQTEDVLRSAGAHEEMIEKTQALNFQLYNLALTEPNIDSVMNKISGFLDEITADLTDKEINEYGFTSDNIRISAMQLFVPWMKYFLSMKPSEYLKKIKCPVLALNGSLDIQVSADENLAAIERFLNEAGNKNFRTVKLEGMNHLFQFAEEGTIREYMLIQETINKQALEHMKNFILGLK